MDSWVHGESRWRWMRPALAILLFTLQISLASMPMGHREGKSLIRGANQVVHNRGVHPLAMIGHGMAPPLLHLRLRGGGDRGVEGGGGGGWGKSQPGGNGGGSQGQRTRKPKKRNKKPLFQLADDGPRRQLPPSIRAAVKKSMQINSKKQQGGRQPARQEFMVPKEGSSREHRGEGYGRKATDDMFDKEEKVQNVRNKQFFNKKKMEIQKSIQLKAMIARKREKLMREYNRTLPPTRPGIEPSLIVSGIPLQVVPRGAGKSEDRARRAAEEARAAARKIMSAKTGTGTGVSRGSRASSDKREGGVVEVGSRVEPTEEFRQRWSGGGPIPNGGVVEQVSDEAVVVKRGDGSSFAFNPSDVSLVTADERSSPLQKEDGTGAGGGSRGAEAGAQVGGRGEFGSGRKEGKREKDKAKAPIGKGWAFDMYEKKQEEIRKIKEAAAARRGRIESEKKEAKERRKMWRKKLGAKTRRGQPVMQHIIEKMTEDFAKQQFVDDAARVGVSPVTPSEDARDHTGT